MHTRRNLQPATRNSCLTFLKDQFLHPSPPFSLLSRRLIHLRGTFVTKPSRASRPLKFLRLLLWFSPMLMLLSPCSHYNLKWWWPNKNLFLRLLRMLYPKRRRMRTLRLRTKIWSCPSKPHHSNLVDRSMRLATLQVPRKVKPQSLNFTSKD